MLDTYSLAFSNPSPLSLPNWSISFSACTAEPFCLKVSTKPSLLNLMPPSDKKLINTLAWSSAWRTSTIGFKLPNASRTPLENILDTLDSTVAYLSTSAWRNVVNTPEFSVARFIAFKPLLISPPIAGAAAGPRLLAIRFASS